MANHFQAHGVRFSYPADWRLREEHAENSTSIDLAGPATATCSVVLLHDCPEPEPVVEAVVEAFQDEYDGIDRFQIDRTIARESAIGCDLDFFYLDLCNSASVRAFRTSRFTALLMCQAGGRDFPVAKEAFEQICETIDCDISA
jgi:hypothetical protein